MRAIILTGLLTGAILTASTAIAHDREAVERERALIHEHCVQCCNAMEVGGEIHVDDGDCVTACDLFTREIVKLGLGL